MEVSQTKVWLEHCSWRPVRCFDSEGVRSWVVKNRVPVGQHFCQRACWRVRDERMRRLLDSLCKIKHNAQYQRLQGTSSDALKLSTI